MYYDFEEAVAPDPWDPAASSRKTNISICCPGNTGNASFEEDAVSSANTDDDDEDEVFEEE